MNIPIFFQPHLSLDSGMDPPPEYTENVPPSDHKTAPSTPNGTPIRTPQFLSRTNSQTSDSSHDRGGFGNPYTVSNAVTAFKSLRSQRSSSQRSINSVSHAVSQNLPKSKSAHSLTYLFFILKKWTFQILFLWFIINFWIYILTYTLSTIIHIFLFLGHCEPASIKASEVGITAASLSVLGIDEALPSHSKTKISKKVRFVEHIGVIICTLFYF